MHERELTIDELIAMKDKEIDLSDIPEADDAFWKNAQVVLPDESQQIRFAVDQEGLDRPHVFQQDLDAAYEQMAQDEKREAEALAWAEATIGDVNHEAW